MALFIWVLIILTILIAMGAEEMSAISPVAADVIKVLLAIFFLTYILIWCFMSFT